MWSLSLPLAKLDSYLSDSRKQLSPIHTFAHLYRLLISGKFSNGSFIHNIQWGVCWVFHFYHFIKYIFSLDNKVVGHVHYCFYICNIFFNLYINKILHQGSSEEKAFIVVVEYIFIYVKIFDFLIMFSVRMICFSAYHWISKILIYLCLLGTTVGWQIIFSI